MESEKQNTQELTSYKLLIDPALTKGFYKVYRFDGIRFNIPVSTSIFLSHIIKVYNSSGWGVKLLFA